MLRQDFKKMMDDAPMLRQPLRDQIGDLREARPLGRNPVEKPREARGECGGLSGQERLLAAPVAPVQDEPRQQQAPAQLGDRRRHRQILRAAVGQRQLVGIEIADRPHPRQQQRGPDHFAVRGYAQECVSQRAHRAAGRQQNSNPRQLKRIGTRHPEQPSRQRRQKRPVRGNRIDLGLHSIFKPC